MSSTRSLRPRAVLFTGTAEDLHRAGDLIAAHAAVRPVRTVVVRPGATAWRDVVEDVAAVIALSDPELPVAEAADGTHLVGGGRAVPIGVFPADPRAIAAAALVQRRAAAGSRLGIGPIALLSSREDHVRARATGLAAALARSRLPFRELPSGRVSRRELLPGLAAGPGLVLYTGEGDARGWRGYGRLQSWEFDRPGAAPMGAVVSLSCSGSARLGSVHGLSEVLVEHGSAASALGAVADVRREDDAQLGSLIVERILDGATCLAEALTPPCPQLGLFRISGDPLAPFVGARGSRVALQRISAPAAGEPLPAVDWR